MKEDWKVFIRGVEGRGDEVIKTLTDLGAKNYGQLDGEDAQDVYFISHNGIIGSTRFDSEVVDLLREYCHEVTLPERWQDGDILVTKGGVFVVFRGIIKTEPRLIIDAYCCVNDDQIFRNDILKPAGVPRLATPSEVEHFHELLHKHGKDWDAENKQLVDYVARWKPDKGDTYYYVDPDCEVATDSWDGEYLDAVRYDFGNCFRSENQAEQARKVLRDTLINCHRNDDADE